MIIRETKNNKENKIVSTFDMSQYVLELEKLVNIDSGTRNVSGVNRIADYFNKKYREIGWNVERHNFDDSVGECLEITNSNDLTYDVLLLGHMDTVFPEGTAKERPFRIEGNYAYGPGVLDMKSGLLSLYYAVKGLEEKLRNASICVALNSDEEIGSRYSRAWIESLALKSKCVFVMEAARPNGELVLERKGAGSYRIDFKGRAAHAGIEPEKGRNAIVELGYWIEQLDSLTDYETGTTINIGVVTGGTATNVVADQAHARVGYRITDLREIEKIEEKIHYLINNPKVEGIQVDVSGGLGRPPMKPSIQTLKLCEVVEKIGKVIGIDIQWTSTGGGSDANLTAALGVPSIDGLGPVGSGGHSISEYIDLDSVEPRMRLVRELIIEIIERSF